MSELNFNYITHKELVDAMKQKKWETKYQMIPHGKKGKAIFVGYRFSCWGIWDSFFHKHVEECDFKIPSMKKITKKTHKKILHHFFEHPDHELRSYSEFDIPA